VVQAHPGRPGVLRNANLQVPPATVVGLEGRSGAGKSTLLAVAAGLERPDSGTVEVMGHPMPWGNEAACSRLRAAHVGLVFQHLHLLGDLSVRENVALPLRLARAAPARREARVDHLLSTFGLQPLARRRPAQLSGGEQQRTAIARALAVEPGLLLVDEPTSSLDDANAQAVVAALQDAARLGAGVLVASHDPMVLRATVRYRMMQGRPVRGMA
ncbi:MAG TPA: ATP-binding cassette domain-containing protein, partial [Candidatus Thermoplasmatota archaeon]|nr:ATP-binding cassette domain-containing protein [Candidatus Thermoplasmatota archaeon]